LLRGAYTRQRVAARRFEIPLTVVFTVSILEPWSYPQDAFERRAADDATKEEIRSPLELFRIRLRLHPSACTEATCHARRHHRSRHRRHCQPGRGYSSLHRAHR